MGEECIFDDAVNEEKKEAGEGGKGRGKSENARKGELSDRRQGLFLGNRRYSGRHSACHVKHAHKLVPAASRNLARTKQVKINSQDKFRMVVTASLKLHMVRKISRGLALSAHFFAAAGQKTKKHTATKQNPPRQYPTKWQSCRTSNSRLFVHRWANTLDASRRIRALRERAAD